ncbi:MAG: DUF4238 domain-containing protein [Sphingorhabdus sp.]
MNAADYTHNHYVPEWYQKRFLCPNKSKLHRLNLAPDIIEYRGKRFKHNDVKEVGPKSCFAEDNLYTTQWGPLTNTDIEQFFFGKIDTKGRAAVNFFCDYGVRNGLHEAYQDLVLYMSVQKLRTPKGLQALAKLLRVGQHNDLLIELQRFQAMHCAVWTDCIWQIADAGKSSTKFIITDHPVTVYNRGCFPGSKHCGPIMDPDIRRVATHTVFPLSPEKLLILTNLSWVRNPYQKELNWGPNKKMFHSTMFNGADIQQGRMLSESEVRQINYIMKQRAMRYLAAGEREWLFPEHHLPSTHWSKLGQGYLLMPEPRDIHMGGEIFVGYDNGRSEAWNEYGQRPWEQGYKDDKRFDKESATLRRFQDEFAAMHGPRWRGWSESFGNSGPHTDSEKTYKWHIDRASKRGVKAGKSV